jgi:hypothetical protein
VGTGIPKCDQHSFTVNAGAPHRFPAFTRCSVFPGDGGRGVAWERRDSMATLKVGMAKYGEIRALHEAAASGDRRAAGDEPKVWFSSTEWFAKAISVSNRELLRLSFEKGPQRAR